MGILQFLGTILSTFIHNFILLISVVLLCYICSVEVFLEYLHLFTFHSCIFWRPFCLPAFRPVHSVYIPTAFWVISYSVPDTDHSLHSVVVPFVVAVDDCVISDAFPMRAILW